METIKIWPGWEMKEQVGEGDLGKVFRIERTDAGITREAALKVIEISGEPGEIKKFRKMGMDEESILEIYEDRKDQLLKAAVRLSCLGTANGIVSIEDIDSFRDEDSSSWTILIRSEYLESLDAYGKKKGGALSPMEIAGMGRDIAGALVTLEKEGILSLSVKPSNVLRNSEGSYKLSDAGINEGIGRLAASKVGSVFAWDAPELVRSGNCDRTSDIYSLGMIMYLLLNGGKRPFLEEGSELKRWIQIRNANEKRVSGEPLPKPAGGDEKLQEIVLKACAPGTEDRFQNAAELREALEIWMFEQKHGKVPAAAGISPAASEPETEIGSGIGEAVTLEEPAEPEPVIRSELQVAEINWDLPEQTEAEDTVSKNSSLAGVQNLFEEQWEKTGSFAAEESEERTAGEEPEESPAEESAAAEAAEEGLAAAEEGLAAAEEGLAAAEAAEEELAEAVAAAEEEEEEEPAEETAAVPAEEIISAVPSEGIVSEEPEASIEAPEEQAEYFAQEYDETDPGDAGILRVKAEENPLQDPMPAGQSDRISLFKKIEEDREPVFSEEEPVRESVQSIEDLFHTPDTLEIPQEESPDQDILPDGPASAGFGMDDEVTDLIGDADRQSIMHPVLPDMADEPVIDSDKLLDDFASDFFKLASDLEDEEPEDEEPSPAEIRQAEPVMPGMAAGVWPEAENQQQSANDDPYEATIVEAPSIVAAPEPEQEETSSSADVFFYIFQREDKLFGIHSCLSENAGGARFKMKSEILETGLFEVILNNLRKRTELPLENAFVTIGSGAAKAEYEERRDMILAAGLRSVTVLDDTAVNALGVFAEELAGEEGEHYVLSVIHDYSGFHSSLLQFNTGEGSEIRILKSSPTAKVENPMDNPAFIMDRMLQDNCRVDGIDYSGRIERVLVDDRNRPLLGSVGQGSFDPYANEVYGSIFRSANLYEGVEVLKGLAYYDRCMKGDRKDVRISLSIADEFPGVEPHESSAAAEMHESGVSEENSWMSFTSIDTAGTHGSESDFMSDPGKNMADPDFPSMESTMIGTDPFAGGGQPFGGTQDPFAGGGQSFGGSRDPFAGGGDAFGGSQDPFAGGGQPFDGNPDPYAGGGQPFGGSPHPAGNGEDMFNATVAGDDFSGQMNGGSAFGDPYRNEVTSNGPEGSFDRESFRKDSSEGGAYRDGFGGLPENNIAGAPGGISYSDKGRLFILNEKKPIKDVTMEVNEGGIDFFRKDVKIALAFGMIGSAIEGKGKQFMHIDFSQVSGFGYEEPVPNMGQRPTLYTTDGKGYIFDFRNIEGTDNILRQIAGAGRQF